jgi:hypothetical protein
VALWENPPKPNNFVPNTLAPNDIAIVLSIGLLPSPFPKELYVQSIDVQPFVNELYFRVSMDHDFLFKAYEGMLKADPWIKQQVEMMARVQSHYKEHGIPQTKTLIFARADYLTHKEKDGKIGLKQVECGISQLGGPGWGASTSQLHRQMLDKVEIMNYGKPPTLAHGEVPENNSSEKMAAAMMLAWEAFGDPDAVIVFLFDAQVITVAYFEQVKFMEVNESLYFNLIYINY